MVVKRTLKKQVCEMIPLPDRQHRHVDFSSRAYARSGLVLSELGGHPGTLLAILRQKTREVSHVLSLVKIRNAYLHVKHYPKAAKHGTGRCLLSVDSLRYRFDYGAQPFTTPSGHRRATFFVRPARCETSTTLSISLYAPGASSLMMRRFLALR